MAINYQRMANTAKRLLTDNNQGKIEIGRAVNTAGGNSWDAPSVSVTYETVRGIVRGVSQQYVDGITVLSTDLMIMATIDDYAPLPGDLMRIDGRVVTVVKQEQIPGAGIIAAWRFIVRA